MRDESPLLNVAHFDDQPDFKASRNKRFGFGRADEDEEEKELFRPTRKRRSSFHDFPNSELIQKHIRDVDAVKLEIQLRIREHEEKWAKLLGNEQKSTAKKVPNKFKSSDNHLNREGLDIVDEVESRSSKMVESKNRKKQDMMAESVSDSSASYPCSNFNTFEP